MDIKSSEKKLLADTIQICLQNKIKIKILPQKTFKGCGGFVDENTKTFLSCFDPNGEYESNWGIFVHESCHVDQLVEKSKIWFNPALESYKDDPLQKHVRGQSNKTKKLEKYFKKTLELELDCEKRSVEKIKKYKLNIDIDNYIKIGNVYLYSYYCFYHLKCWYDKKLRIYDQEELIELMPNKHLKLNDYWKKHTEIYEFLKNNNSKSLL